MVASYIHAQTRMVLIALLIVMVGIEAGIPDSPPFIDECTTIGNEKACEASDCIWSTKW